jgi:hypothetical protein
MAEAPSAPGTDLASQAREAVRCLGPLLRRRGTSVEVGQRLRRAIQHLDKALSDPEVASGEIRSAADELTACAEVIRTSERKSDHDQLTGVNSALAALGALRSARTGTLLSTPDHPVFSDLPMPPSVSVPASLPVQNHPPIPILPPSSFQESVPEPRPVLPLSAETPGPTSISRSDGQVPEAPRLAEPRGRRSEETAKGYGAGVAIVPNIFSEIAELPPYRTEEVVAGILTKLAGLYARRRRLLANVLASWRDLRDMDRQMQNAIGSLSWNEAAVSQPARTMLESAEEEPERFAAALALLHVGRAEAVLSFLSTSSDREIGIGDGTLSAIRMAGDSALWQQLVAISPPIADANAYHLSWLADRGELSADVLFARLDDPSDATAVRAAELLAWLGRSRADTRVVEARLHAGVGEERVCPFLYAAVALGSLKALEEIRRRIDAGEPVTKHAVDALAVAGSARDSQRLIRLASRDEALAPVALLAAGHLGDRATAALLATGVEPQAVAERARRTTLADGDNTEPGRTRLLYGDAWTLSGVLARLAAPEELVRSRSWFALEAAVRTGARPLAVLDTSARVSIQDAAGARIRAALEEWRHPIPDGAWFYFGQPLA